MNEKIVLKSLLVALVLLGAGCLENPSIYNRTTAVTSVPVSDEVVKEKIRSNLIGFSIEYYSISGKPVIFEITEKDIKRIEKTIRENRIVWKVRIGEGLAWDLYYDELGNELIEKNQLFMT